MFNVHARKILIKARTATSILKQLLSSKHLSQKTKILMYKTLIRPIIAYGFGSWFTISPTAAKELGTFERKILRFCCGKYRRPNKKWYSNRTLHDITKVTPLIAYMTESLQKRLQATASHPNPLIKALWDANVNESVHDHYYLSPFNLLHDRSRSVLQFTLNRAPTLPFYEKSSLPNLRG